jgi:prophage regulatory protein
MIYVIQAQNGPIKIGVSVYVEGRIAGIQTGNPHTITLLGTIMDDRDYDLEKEIHKRLFPYQLCGEWFDNNKEVCAYVIELLSGKKATFICPPGLKAETVIIKNIDAEIKNIDARKTDAIINNDSVDIRSQDYGRKKVMDGKRFIKLKDVEEAVSMKKSSIYKKMEQGFFPLSLRMGPRSVVWSVKEINSWIDNVLSGGGGVKWEKEVIKFY